MAKRPKKFFVKKKRTPAWGPRSSSDLQLRKERILENPAKGGIGGKKGTQTQESNCQTSLNGRVAAGEKKKFKGDEKVWDQGLGKGPGRGGERFMANRS